MDENDKLRESLGYSPEIIKILNMPRTPAMESVDRMFLNKAVEALAAERYSALEFLSANPRLSKLELVQKLNRRINAIGLIMAIYDEATKQGVTREVAKDLLIREIRHEFAQGWSTQGNIAPSVRLGRWYSEVTDYSGDPALEAYAKSILQNLAIDHQPPEGWSPQWSNDPLVDDLFNRYWPVEPKR